MPVIQPTLDNLHKAVCANDKKAVETCLAGGVDVNGKSISGLTALYLAAEKADWPILEILLQNKADANLCDGAGYTPLHAAIAAGKFDNADCLLDYGVEINAVTLAEIGTPLVVAIEKDAEEGGSARVDFMLSRGASINIPLERPNEFPIEMTDFARHQKNGTDLFSAAFMKHRNIDLVQTPTPRAVVPVMPLRIKFETAGFSQPVVDFQRVFAASRSKYNLKAKL